jgi:arylsulfatase A-like enzyme
MRASGKIPSWLRGFPARLRAAGYYTSNNAKTDYNSPINIQEAWNVSNRNAHWRNRGPGQPFFSVFNHEVSHESGLFPSNEPSPFDPAKMRLPPYQPDTPEIRADWARYYTRIKRLDDQIAVKLKNLADAGLAEDTIVFYYSDNGGVLPRSKRFLQESGTHVPLIVYFPPKWRHLAPASPGYRIKDPVHFIDFAPTVLSLAGVKIPDYMQGRAFAGAAKAAPNEFVFCMRDRMDERYDMMRSVMDKRWLYIHNYRPDLPYVQPLDYMFQARGYQSWARLAGEGKLTPATAMFWGEKPTEELYDMLADPDSVHNLAADPAQRQTVDRMRAALEKRTRWKVTTRRACPAHSRLSASSHWPILPPSATPPICRSLSRRWMTRVNLCAGGLRKAAPCFASKPHPRKPLCANGSPTNLVPCRSSRRKRWPGLVSWKSRCRCWNAGLSKQTPRHLRCRPPMCSTVSGRPPGPRCQP